MPDAHDWLDTDYRTLFRLHPDRRIERENDPDCSPGPRFWLGRSADGNLAGIRADVPTAVADELAHPSSEPPLADHMQPAHLDRYLALLAPVPHWNIGLVCPLPHALGFDTDARVALIDGDSDAGRHLLHALSTHGMPEGLYSMGFRSAADLWAPWCAAVVDGEVASVAFAARLSEAGAELGLATATAFRGRGRGGGDRGVVAAAVASNAHAVLQHRQRQPRVTTRGVAPRPHAARHDAASGIALEPARHLNERRRSP